MRSQEANAKPTTQPTMLPKRDSCDQLRFVLGWLQSAFGAGIAVSAQSASAPAASE